MDNTETTNKRPTYLYAIVPELPEQDLGPWVDAVGALCSDGTAYAALSARARTAATAFAARTGIAGYEEVLARVTGRTR